MSQIILPLNIYWRAKFYEIGSHPSLDKCLQTTSAGVFLESFAPLLLIDGEV